MGRWFRLNQLKRMPDPEQAIGKVIYKIVTPAQWAIAESNGEFHGAPIDLKDGYIHFSTPQQVRETVEKHFQGQAQLLIVSVDADQLGDELKWEPSRGGDLFPHLYGCLAMASVISVEELPLGECGKHIFPEGIAAK